MSEPTTPEYLIIGEIVGAFGVRGELKLEMLSDHPERYARLKRVYLGGGPDGAKERHEFEVQGARLHTAKRQALMRLAGITSPEQADKLRGLLVQVPVNEAWPLEEGAYYEFQIIGLDVRTTAGRELGKVTTILYLSSNDVYTVKASDPTAKEYLIPAIKDVIKEINLEGGYILIEPLEGLLD
jgi:16S rRNA processing protein RimM